MADDDLYQELPENEPQTEWEPPAAAAGEDLPDRLRVHSLARVLGTTSRRVLDALSEFDGRARSPHSSVDRTDAVRVRDVLAAGPEDSTDEPAAQEPPAPEAEVLEVDTEAADSP